MRAKEPDVEGSLQRDGVTIGYEVFGHGEPAVVFVPIDAIVHSRAWKAQVPYLAQEHRVVTIDPRGNGRSDRPRDRDAYADTQYVDDTLAVMDAVGVDRAVLIGLCTAGWRALLTAATHPDRVLGVVSVSTWAPNVAPPLPERKQYDFDTPRDEYPGWAKVNRHYWATNWRDFTEFFFTTLICEPHSTKQIEDCLGWAMQTDPDTMVLQHSGPISVSSREEAEKLLRSVRCPVLTIHGEQDRCQPLARSERVAELTGGQLLRLSHVGHLPQAREPVVVNQAIRDFVRQFEQLRPIRRWSRPIDRSPRVLFLSSPIGLGHSRRDIAIADELRRMRPEVRVEWLAQEPLTLLLERLGETIHPASRQLASEASHVDSECAEHDLHAFQTVRRMDEILVNNFMVFSDLVEERDYDVWIGDEAWELDYFLHENPRLKRAPFVWLTDFVGWLPMPDGGDAEAALTADYNAEMIEQVARFPKLRDRSLFVGNPDDIVTDRLGAELPGIREWTEGHFDFVGYVSGFDPAAVADREAVRASLGYRHDDVVCVVTVGSAVGRHLLQRVVDAYPRMSDDLPGLRMVVACGPRIDPDSTSAPSGVEMHGYVPDLYRHLAACDLAIVQGGLTTTMELTANRRPFVYVPLRHHFEQNFHVPHRLDRYRAGRRMEYAEITPDALTEAALGEVRRPRDYRPVETDGAQRAAARIVELL